MQIQISNALAISRQVGYVPVIPDIKCVSPEHGDLMRGRDPVQLATHLAQAGAPAISVVTESGAFGGSMRLLERVAVATRLPILRKDFIKTESELKKSLDYGASGVLLIMGILEPNALIHLFETAVQMGLEPLVETHTQEELKLAARLPVTLLGINNRDILQLEIDNGTVNNTEALARLAPPGALLVSESAIRSVQDVERAIGCGAHAVLVGTAILQAPDPIACFQAFRKGGLAG